MKSFIKYNLFLSIVYALRLHFYFKDGKIAKFISRLYQKLLYYGRGSRVIKSHTNGQKMICTFGHQLPFYQIGYPLYDRQLSKLCHYLHNEQKRPINIIDVGANVGDTVLNIGLKDAFYLCIEGNDSFAKLIKHNLKHRYKYSLETCYLTDNPTDKNYRPEITNGTNRLVLSDNNSCEGGIFTQTLDQLIDEKYKDCIFNLIKIDTDGFDFKVIRGASHSLKQWKPLLFFEWDKAYCKEQGEDPLSIFPILEELGYLDCILFDNFGNPFDFVQTLDITKLSYYIENTIGDGLPYYYDVLAINKNGYYNTNQLINLFFNS